jgi:hypothetical protein
MEAEPLGVLHVARDTMWQAIKLPTNVSAATLP